MSIIPHGTMTKDALDAYVSAAASKIATEHPLSIGAACVANYISSGLLPPDLPNDYSTVWNVVGRVTEQKTGTVGFRPLIIRRDGEKLFVRIGLEGQEEELRLPPEFMGAIHGSTKDLKGEELVPAWIE